MIKNIEPLHKDNRNCYEDVIVTICNWFQRRYECIYEYSWAFEYERLETSNTFNLGKYLKYNNSKRRSLLCKYSGIEMINHKYEELDKGLKDIKIKLNNNIPIALTSMDMFWLYWTPHYKKSHGGHTIIAIDVDNESNIICMDPYFKRKKLKLSIEDFNLSSSRKYISFNIVSDEMRYSDVNSIINSAVSELLRKRNSENSFDNMRKFADDIKLYYNAKNEMKGYQDYFTVPIYNTIQRIGQGRKQFSELLVFLSENYSCNKNLLKKYSNSINLMGKKWDALKVLFGKEVFLSDYTLVKNKAPIKIYDIANYEEEIAKEIFECNFN
ncbi:BtrH N-terminal domain-containing protein [Clostridium felsineum]|uniref:BtrH N-terminal domain-containing protein n=1 Tax=Clostridium felsineum TaxID=36839 RepID=UPI00098C5FB0|nr:BtrH N-terminal domain-containing protein [Clostridium felsineum]URZ18150.1 hypothetical protein CLFE_042050 [Clostridium felsineum DSM 794]